MTESSEKQNNEQSENGLQTSKRLDQAEAEELSQALKEAFSGVVATGKTKAPQSPAEHVARVDEVPETQVRNGYSNPLPLFADIFYGVLVAPRPTMTILSDSTKFPPTPANLTLSTVAVLVPLAMPAAIKAGMAGTAGEASLKALLFITGSLVNWTLLSFTLFYLSIWMRGNKLTLGNAFIATGWAFLPFAFFAPVACFKNLLGSSFIYFAALPALWFLFLQWLAFQTSLRTSAVKLALIAVVVPPLFCMIYFFWLALALFLLLSQLIAHLG